MNKYCERCGVELNSEAKGIYCNPCRAVVHRERHEREKKKQIAARLKSKPPVPTLAGDIPGKNRCMTCGHAFKYDTSGDVACGYICQVDIYDLPMRPRPSADPNHCLYWSKRPTAAGWFTEAEKEKIFDRNFHQVVDTKKCCVYKNEAEAAMKANVSVDVVMEECQKTDEINAVRRFRYLAPEEFALIKPKGDAGDGHKACGTI